MTWELRQGDALHRLREMPDESVQTCVTSPPYFGLRDYGIDGQLGLEDSPDDHVARLVDVLSEVRRVLRDDGTLWLNYGDAYNTRQRGTDKGWDKSRLTNPARVQKAQAASLRPRRAYTGSKPKDLLGLPWMLAFALRADGWWLRSDIIWHKPAPMPESVTDRPTRAHEYVFLLTKSARYFYDGDAIRERDAGVDHPRHVLHRPEPSGGILPPHNGIRRSGGRNGSGRNRRTVWTIPPSPFPEAHFATFPPALVEPMVLAGSATTTCADCGAPYQRILERAQTRGDWNSREKADARIQSSDQGLSGNNFYEGWSAPETVGWKPTCEHSEVGTPSTVLDPFAGAGTTLMVAERLGRDSIGIEINPEYVELARRRIIDDCPLHNTAAEAAA